LEMLVLTFTETLDDIYHLWPDNLYNVTFLRKIF
jgi:hypothetical protein